MRTVNVAAGWKNTLAERLLEVFVCAESVIGLFCQLNSSPKPAAST